MSEATNTVSELDQARYDLNFLEHLYASELSSNAGMAIRLKGVPEPLAANLVEFKGTKRLAVYMTPHAMSILGERLLCCGSDYEVTDHLERALERAHFSEFLWHSEANSKKIAGQIEPASFAMRAAAKKKAQEKRAQEEEEAQLNEATE